MFYTNPYNIPVGKLKGRTSLGNLSPAERIILKGTSGKKDEWILFIWIRSDILKTANNFLIF